MKFMMLILIFMVNVAVSQTIEVRWSDKFTKELLVSCQAEDFCESLCGESSCTIEEGICHNCIGTGLQIYQLFTELGKSIRRGDELEGRFTLELLLRGSFVTFSPNDVYNVIDPANSISVYRRFEGLCPGESMSQLIFFEVDPFSRKILAPFSLYCEYEEESVFFTLK